MSQTLQSVLCITTNKYLVRVLVVLLHARFQWRRKHAKSGGAEIGCGLQANLDPKCAYVYAVYVIVAPTHIDLSIISALRCMQEFTIGTLSLIVVQG